VYNELDTFIKKNTGLLNVKKDMIFSYPPILYKDTDTIISGLSQQANTEGIIEGQMRALWNILGRHIYGRSDEKENQIKEIFRKHRELLDLEKKILRSFSDGKKIKLAHKEEHVRVQDKLQHHKSLKEPKTPGKMRLSGINPMIIRQATAMGSREGLFGP